MSHVLKILWDKVGSHRRALSGGSQGEVPLSAKRIRTISVHGSDSEPEERPLAQGEEEDSLSSPAHKRMHAALKMQGREYQLSPSKCFYALAKRSI